MSADAAPVAPRRSKGPLILGLVLALAGAGGGFAAVRLGLVGGGAPAAEAEAGHGGDHAAPAVAFVPLDPVTVNLPGQPGRFLRFQGSLEVAPEHAEEVAGLAPRVLDVLNGFLRAVEAAELADPAGLVGLRAQMLRRVQVVAGPGRVRDLLVAEFVVN